jgi:hypothetical protein
MEMLREAFAGKFALPELHFLESVPHLPRSSSLLDSALAMEGEPRSHQVSSVERPYEKAEPRLLLLQ